MASEKTNALGMRLPYSADAGSFHVDGCTGVTNQDRFNHFCNMVEYLKKVSWNEPQKAEAQKPERETLCVLRTLTGFVVKDSGPDRSPLRR